MSSEKSDQKSCQKCGRYRRNWRKGVAITMVSLGVVYCLCHLNVFFNASEKGIPDPEYTPAMGAYPTNTSSTTTSTTLTTTSASGDASYIEIIPKIREYSALELNQQEIQFPPYPQSVFERMLKKAPSEVNPKFF